MGTSGTTGEKALKGAGVLKAKVEKLEAHVKSQEEEIDQLRGENDALVEKIRSTEVSREGRPFDLWEIALAGVLCQKTRHNLENLARLFRRPVEEVDKLIHWRQVKTRLPHEEANDIREKLKRARYVYEEVKLCLRVDFPDPPFIDAEDGVLERDLENRAIVEAV